MPGGAIIEADCFAVRLNPAVVTTDVAEFEAALQSADRAGSETERTQFLVHAVDLYRGPLLPGYYQDWIVAEQRRLADRYSEAVRLLTAHLEDVGEFGRALEYARRAVGFDPLREEAHRDLIWVLAAAGQTMMRTCG